MGNRSFHRNTRFVAGAKRHHSVIVAELNYGRYMWYLTITDTEQSTQPDHAKAEQFDEPAPPSGGREKADEAIAPGSEYWLP